MIKTEMALMGVPRHLQETKVTDVPLSYTIKLRNVAKIYGIQTYFMLGNRTPLKDSCISLLVQALFLSGKIKDGSWITTINDLWTLGNDNDLYVFMNLDGSGYLDERLRQCLYDLAHRKAYLILDVLSLDSAKDKLGESLSQYLYASGIGVDVSCETPKMLIK